MRKKVERALGYVADCASSTGFRVSERLEYAKAVRELAEAHYFMTLSERAQNDPTFWPSLPTSWPERPARTDDEENPDA